MSRLRAMSDRVDSLNCRPWRCHYTVAGSISNSPFLSRYFAVGPGADVVDVGGDGDPTNDTVSAVNDTRTGWFAYADYAWDQYHSVGLQYSSTELTDGAGSDANEIEAYYTWNLSEFQRIRFAASALESDLDPDAQRFAVQYTAIVGAHGHGVNW